MNSESLMSIQEIIDLYGGLWSQHPRYPFSKWKRSAEYDDTRLGYWHWVLKQVKQEQ